MRHIYATRHVLTIKHQNLIQKVKETERDIYFLDFIAQNLTLLANPDELYDLWLEEERRVFGIEHGKKED